MFRAGAGQTGISSEEVAANPGAFYGNDEESSSTESSSSGSDSDESDSDASSSEGSDSDDSEESSADASSASDSDDSEEESSSSGEEEAKAPPPSDPFDMFAAPSSAPATSNDDILKGDTAQRLCSVAKARWGVRLLRETTPPAAFCGLRARPARPQIALNRQGEWVRAPPSTRREVRF